MARLMLRFLGTRYGLALVLIVLVVAVVGVARGLGGPARVEQTGPPPPVGVPASSTSELGDDSVATSEDPQTPSVIAGLPGPEAVALDFARAWLKTDGVSAEQWLESLRRHATDRLMERLAGADPAGVPATAIRGAARIRTRDSQLVEISIPVEPGTLHVRLLVEKGRWLVDGVDWERP